MEILLSSRLSDAGEHRYFDRTGSKASPKAHHVPLIIGDYDANTRRASSYLVLPWNGHTAGVEFAVERVVGGVQIDTFHRGELLDVQDVFSVNRARL